MFTKEELRQIANRKILEEIKGLVEKYPDIRFTQLLINMGIVEERFEDCKRIIECDWNEESVDTLEKIRKTTTLILQNSKKEI